MGGARQAKGARRVAKKKPNRLGPERAPSVMLFHLSCSLPLPLTSPLCFALLFTTFSSVPPSFLLSALLTKIKT